MKPRYLVIADYPNSIYKIGRILEQDDLQYFNYDHFNKYPHIFRPLQWWEQRKPEEMPEFVKFTADYMGFTKVEVYRLENWGDQLEKGFIPFRKSEDKYGLCAVPPYFNQIEPATLSEYEAYKSNQTAPPRMDGNEK